MNRPRFDAVSFRVWKENIDHAEEVNRPGFHAARLNGPRCLQRRQRAHRVVLVDRATRVPRPLDLDIED